MKRTLNLLIICTLSITIHGQKVWTVDECMQYAAEHNHDVRIGIINLDDYKADRARTIGSLLPSVDASIGGQYNFGRAIDPETNTYTNVSTFNNGYSISTSIPVFDGLQRYNNACAAKANILMGKQGVRAQKDNACQQVFKAYIDVLYYKGTLAMAQEKRKESRMLLQQTKVMEEIGTKGEADVAQMQATFATDDYEVTRQEGLLANAILALKKEMNYPVEESLTVQSPDPLPAPPKGGEQSPIAFETISTPLWEGTEKGTGVGGGLPAIETAKYALLSAKYNYRSSKGALFPSLSIGAGMSTTYNRQLGNPNTRSFHEQFRNNAGQYVCLTLSIPIFNRLATWSYIRKARNNVARARENLDYQQSELQRMIQETQIDKENSTKETEKMQRKVESDSIASRLTIRKYEEGLASSIDVQTATVTLLQSKAGLLQCQLMYMYKSRMLEYYRTGTWIEY